MSFDNTLKNFPKFLDKIPIRSHKDTAFYKALLDLQKQIHESTRKCPSYVREEYIIPSIRKIVDSIKALKLTWITLDLENKLKIFSKIEDYLDDIQIYIDLAYNIKEIKLKGYSAIINKHNLAMNQCNNWKSSIESKIMMNKKKSKNSSSKDNG